jgi:AcrR family transcriptional regulator
VCARVSRAKRDQYLQDRREAILDAAIDVFGRQGFPGSTVEEIAHAAHITKGTVYLYFASKEEILASILAERSDLPHLGEITLDPDAQIRDTLMQFARRFLELEVEHLPVFRLSLSEAYRVPSYGERLYSGTLSGWHRLLACYLETQVAAGRIGALPDATLTARTFTAMLIGYIVAQHILGGERINPIDPEAWIARQVSVFLDGIGPVRSQGDGPQSDPGTPA